MILKSSGITFEIGRMESQTLLDGTYVPAYFWIGASDSKGQHINIGFNPQSSQDDAVAWIKKNASKFRKAK